MLSHLSLILIELNKHDESKYLAKQTEIEDLIQRGQLILEKYEND